MATPAQIDANRLNAQQSTGPSTEQGKAVSSQNAYRHGLRSASAVAPGEDPAEYLAFAQAVLAELDPAGISQRVLAERIAFLQWKLRRIPTVEYMMMSRTKIDLGDDVECMMERFPANLSAAVLIACDLDSVLKLQTYELRLQRSLQQAQRQYGEMKRQASEAKERSERPAPPPAKPPAPPAETPQQPAPSPDAIGDNPHPGQALRENWVRSADSPQTPVPAPAPPDAQPKTEVVA